jgi:hypothetical protein
MSYLSLQEQDAIKAFKAAIEAARVARVRAEAADYGSLVLGALDEAQRALKYALDLVEGRG